MMRVLLAAAVAFVVSTGTASAVVEPTRRQLKGSLADAPAVKLHVTFKRKSMKLHGQSEFDIYATPVVSANGASVLYNGYASFQDEDTDFTYTFVDGSAYLTTADSSTLETVRCLPPHTLPFNKILPALNEATRIPSASVGKKEVECASGNMYKTTFAGVHYAICSSGESGFTAVSSDLNIDVEYLDGPVNIEKPELSDGSASCEVLAKATSLTPTALALATGEALPSSKSRNLVEASHMAMDETECQCLSTPRPCIFLHGLGNPNEEITLQDTPELTKKKFGDIHGHAPCCSTIKYAVLNTNDAGWRNDTLQQKFCDHSLSMSETSDVASGTIDNTIIVTHSMGGLVMAGALAKGKCKFSETTSWVALSPPMKGSMASDFLLGICSGDDTKVVADLFDLIGQCPMPKSRKSTTYQDGEYTTQSINDAYVAAQLAYRGNVTAAMCSDSFFGLFSTYQASCIIGGTVIPHKSKKNDGLVEFQSCVAGLDETMFGNHYLDKFYKPQLNHADTAFLTGEGLIKDSQKPFKWFECLALNRRHLPFLATLFFLAPPSASSASPTDFTAVDLRPESPLHAQNVVYGVPKLFRVSGLQPAAVYDIKVSYPASQPSLFTLHVERVLLPLPVDGPVEFDVNTANIAGNIMKPRRRVLNTAKLRLHPHELETHESVRYRLEPSGRAMEVEFSLLAEVEGVRRPNIKLDLTECSFDIVVEEVLLEAFLEIHWC